MSRASPDLALVGNVTIVTAIGGVVGYLFPEKPFGYDVALIVPGILGALSGHVVGYWLLRKLRFAIRVGVGVVLVVLTIVVNQLYLGLVSRGGIPPWYDYALYPAFFFQIALAFAFFGLLGLGLPTGKGNGDNQQSTPGEADGSGDKDRSEDGSEVHDRSA